jgi:UDPglucose 6-dehydrogenase
MDVAIIGSGHVGLVAGGCLAEIGHQVLCVDSDTRKIEMLESGVSPIYEPGLDELLERNHAAGRLAYTTSLEDAVRGSQVVFICVGTPATESGEANLYYVDKVAGEIGALLAEPKTIVEKSTVPVRTGACVRRAIERTSGTTDFDVVSNPEFLREGSAVHDFFFPDRIVVGVESDRAAAVMSELYQPIIDQSFALARQREPRLAHAPMIVTSVSSAELIKHAANSFLALKISYINALSRVCELAGADVEEVAEGLGLDRRIGKQFLKAGAGYGGYCLPKDVAAFHQICRELGYDFGLLQEVIRINDAQKRSIVEKLGKALWLLRDKTVAVLGLSFKPDTDDMRESPAIDVIRSLQAQGAQVRAYDPHAMDVARTVLPDIAYCDDAYDAATGAHGLVVMTEWAEFGELDLARLKAALRLPVIVDGRNVFDPRTMRDLGFEYYSVGRSAHD